MFVVNHDLGIICMTTRIDKHNCLKLIYQEFELDYLEAGEISISRGGVATTRKNHLKAVIFGDTVGLKEFEPLFHTFPFYLNFLSYVCILYMYILFSYVKCAKYSTYCLGGDINHKHIKHCR